MLRQSERVRKESMLRYGFGIDAMRSVKVCETCGEMADVSQQYCKECGRRLPEHTLYDIYKERHKVCPACDTVLSDGMEYCPQCGTAIEKKLNPTKDQ